MNENEEFIEYDRFSKKMEEQFPLMFAGRYGGFGVGKGWWPILEALCNNIQRHIDWSHKQRAWDIEKGNEPREVVPQVTVAQIKEKFGGLRFYYDGGDDTIDGMVRMAESWASVSCEECGAPGVQRPGGWVKTLCDQHAAEREAKYRQIAKENGFEE